METRTETYRMRCVGDSQARSHVKLVEANGGRTFCQIPRADFVRTDYLPQRNDVFDLTLAIDVDASGTVIMGVSVVGIGNVELAV